MLCPRCKSGQCIVTNLSKKYAPVLEQVNRNLLLPSTEISILHTLHSEKGSMYANEVAGELDCSYQLVGKRGRNLVERGLAKRVTEASQRRSFGRLIPLA